MPKGPVKGSFTFSQWPLYIDPGKKGTIAEFEKATGVDVKYVEEINDNDQFFGKIRPQLERGDSGGRSMITVSDWLAARMDKLGYLQHFDYSKLPNVKKNLIPALRHPAADPNRGVHDSVAERDDRPDRALGPGARTSTRSTTSTTRSTRAR